jgi:FecR protein
MSPRTRQLILSAALMGVALCADAAQQPATRSATAPTTTATQPVGQNLPIRVIEVVGIVRYRKANGELLPVTVGMELQEGYELQTASKSRVRYAIPPDQVITIDRFSSSRVLTARAIGPAEVKTNVDLEYGRLKYQVQESGVKHDTTVRSPNATLAVRGTKDMLLYDQAPYATVAYATQPVDFRNLRGQRVRFGQTGRQARVRGDKQGAGETALVEARVNPTGKFAGKSDPETTLDQILGGFSGTNLSDQGILGLIAQSRSGAFKGTAIGVITIESQLLFILTWNGKPGLDIDLSVKSPLLGEVVSVKNPMVTSSGKHLGEAVDKQEHIVWAREFPAGPYTMAADLKGKGQANIQFSVIKNPGLMNSRQLAKIKDTVNSERRHVEYTVTAK